MAAHPQSHNVKSTGKHRRRAYLIWIGAMIAMFAFVLVAPVFLPFFGVSAPAVGVPLPFFMIAITLFGLGWLVFYVFGARKKRDPDYQRRPATSDDAPPGRKSDEA